MSVIDLSEAKQFLDVIHSADDAKIQMLLDGAEDEALQFMNRDQFGEEACSEELASEVVLPDSVKVGVLLLLQANYQAKPEDVERIREVAEIKLMPYRRCLGV